MTKGHSKGGSNHRGNNTGKKKSKEGVVMKKGAEEEERRQVVNDTKMHLKGLVDLTARLRSSIGNGK